MEDATYTGLRKLKVKGKDLDDLPESIFQLRELEVLDLSPEREACIDFHLVLLPPSISLLLHLRVLMLDTNSLSHLPPSISALSRLQQLSLSNNFVSQLPQEMDQLQELSSIHLSNNHFQVFPEVLVHFLLLIFFIIFFNLFASNQPYLTTTTTNTKKLHQLPQQHQKASPISTTPPFLGLMFLAKSRSRGHKLQQNQHPSGLHHLPPQAAHLHRMPQLHPGLA